MSTGSWPAAPLRVAVGQAESVPGAVADNAGTAARLVTAAAERSARVVVLPELFLPGYHPPTLAADSGTDVHADEAGAVDDRRLDPLRDSAAAADVVVVVGAAVRAPDGARYLSSLVVRPDGSVREEYRKQFLCGPEERSLFAAGRQGADLQVDGWVLALAVCYDGCFPEHARAAALRGAHAYLCSAAYLTGSGHRRDLYYRARAVENGMFVALSDAVGGPAPWTFGGGSAVHDPEGRPLVRAAAGQQDVVVAELDPLLQQQTRRDHTMLSDLRTAGG